MKESVAIAKEAAAKKESSPTRSDNSIHHARNEPKRQLGSLRGVIGNIRRDGGTPSVDSLSTELSGMHSTAQRAPVLLALQRTHGNRYVQRVVAGIQAKLKVGQPGDIYEQEADRVAYEVMRMPEPHVQRQVEEEEILQTKRGEDVTPEVTQDLESQIRAIQGGGQPLTESDRAFFEPRFGHDFSRVRVHTDTKATESTQAVNALAYTVGQNIVFGAGRYTPQSSTVRQLLAHELTHVIQQRSSGQQISQPISLSDPSLASEKEAERAATEIAIDKIPDVVLSEPEYVARICTGITICSPQGVPGSAQQFGQSEASAETSPRRRRSSMTQVRASASGHAGRALQLENFLRAQAPGRLNNIQGIFIDQDLSPGTGGLAVNCASWISSSLPPGSTTPPGMAGATRDCIFVHGNLNQEALSFNDTPNATIGGQPREVWRVETLQLLIHETEHPRFEAATASRAQPLGVTSATCARVNIVNELSELAALMSEFPTVSRSAATESDPTGPIHASMESWFPRIIRTSGENIEGALLQMGCFCECLEVDAFVIDTFNEVTSAGSWSVSEKNDFNARLRAELPATSRPSWPL
jgi:hypothetical protein